MDTPAALAESVLLGWLRMALAASFALAGWLLVDEVIGDPSLVHVLGIFFIAGALSGQWLSVFIVPGLTLILLGYRALDPEPGTYYEVHPVIVGTYIALAGGMVTVFGVASWKILKGVVRQTTAADRNDG
jgi:hypothetical protein